jgi:hypothetical protein
MKMIIFFIKCSSSYLKADIDIRAVANVVTDGHFQFNRVRRLADCVAADRSEPT